MKYLIFFVLYLFSCLQANDTFYTENSLKNDASWIKKCQGDKIYLKEEYLFIDSSSIGIVDDRGEYIPLKTLKGKCVVCGNIP